ncbi:MAG: ABC transporter ATP-binding protein [Methylophaga sp.]|nr:ABC transporter ATP-binding protein [Methylophaga sp.]
MLIESKQLACKIEHATLLSDISFTVAQGDYLSIVGPNGSGKSTLIRCLMGILQPSAGELILKGQPLHSYPRRALARQISYVPQAVQTQSMAFTVLDFVRMARYAYHHPFSEWQPSDEAAVQQALEITHTTDFSCRQCNTLSGGELQRVMIASALAQQSPLMLLDEPTTFLDPHHQVAVHQLLQTLNQQHGMTIIEVTHDINHASQHSQHILALHQGQMMWHGQASEFMEAQRLYDLYQQDFIFVRHPQTGRLLALADES